MVKSLGADEVSEANIPWWLNENYKMHRYLPDIPETRILWQLVMWDVLGFCSQAAFCNLISEKADGNASFGADISSGS